jgi:hypothetical protein
MTKSDKPSSDADKPSPDPNTESAEGDKKVSNSASQ